MAGDTVKIEIEVGDVEVEFEGPADFARKDLLPLVRGLVEALSAIAEEEDDEDEAGGDAASPAAAAGA